MSNAPTVSFSQLPSLPLQDVAENHVDVENGSYPAKIYHSSTFKSYQETKPPLTRRVTDMVTSVDQSIPSIAGPAASVMGTLTLTRKPTIGYDGSIVGVFPEPSDDDLVEEALAQIGYGKYQKRLFWLCSFGWLNDALYWTGLSYSLVGIGNSFGVSDALTSLIMSMFYLGCAVGEIFWGFFAGIKGRRITFGLTLGLCGLSAVILAVMPFFWLVCLASILLGMMYGGNVALDSCLFLEWIPKAKASQMAYMNMIFWAGSVIPSLLAWAIIPLSISWGSVSYYADASWRVYMLILAGLNFIMIISRRLFLPLYETPYWLVSRGRFQDAADAIRKMAEYNGIPIEGKLALEVRHANDPPIVEQPKDESFFQSVKNGSQDAFNHVKELWKDTTAPDQRRATLLVFLLWGIWYFGNTMFGSMVAVLLSNLQLTSPSDTYRDLVIYTVCAVPSAFVCKYFLDWPLLGRVGTTWTSTVFMSLSLIGFGIVCIVTTNSTTLDGSDPPNHTSLVVGSVVTSVLYNASQQVAATALWLLTPEMYVAKYRTQIMGTAMALGRVTAIFAPLISGALLTAATPYYNALPPFVAAGVLLIAALVCYLIPYETFPPAAANSWRKLAFSVAQAKAYAEENQ